MAQRGAGKVSPNPLVGAVLVCKGRVIGEGFHRAWGEAHAEVMAFDSVAEHDRHLIPKSTLYVNLEPCSHYGKTPPCSLRVIKEGVKKVVIGAQDPNPQVSGKGVAMLKENGVDVITGILEKEARFLNRFFYTFHEQKRPYIILKWAQSKDGFIGREGERTRLSGPLAQIVSHRWRKEADAILVGSQTAVIDNPVLTDRWHGGPDPLRILIDRHGKVPSGQDLLSDPQETWIFSYREKPGHLNKNKFWHLCKEGENMLIQILNRLFVAEKNSILIEGGAIIHNQWIESGLWDEVRMIETNDTLGDGIRSANVQGRLIQQYAAGSDEIRLITKSKGTMMNH